MVRDVYSDHLEPVVLGKGCVGVEGSEWVSHIGVEVGQSVANSQVRVYEGCPDLPYSTYSACTEFLWV